MKEYAFEVGYEFNGYGDEAYFIGRIDNEDDEYPYEAYPLSAKEKFEELSNDCCSDEYFDMLETRRCFSERELFEIKIEYLENLIKKLKNDETTND